MTKAYSVRLDDSLLSTLQGIDGSTLSDKVRNILSWLGMYPEYKEDIKTFLNYNRMTNES